MKIPKIRQLPSGMWFCQLRIDGQSVSITDADYNVVEAKAYAYKGGVLKARKAVGPITVGQALIKYIRARENVLSPSTLRGYNTIKRSRFLRLQNRRVSDLTQAIVQNEINYESTLCSPKTLKNAFMLISSAIVEAGGERFNVRLKQIPPTEKLYLTPKQIPVLLNAIQGDEYEIPILLGLWSCRRSEILGLTWDDVDLKNNTIKIRKSIVYNENGKLVEKPIPKNKSSVRTIPICAQLHTALETVEDKTGKVVKCYPNTIYRATNRICEKNGLPAVGAHGLRHSFASLAYHLQIPAKIAMKIGGWETDETMMKIYTHISKDDVGKAATELSEFFDAARCTSTENA